MNLEQQMGGESSLKTEFESAVTLLNETKKEVSEFLNSHTEEGMVGNLNTIVNGRDPELNAKLLELSVAIGNANNLINISENFISPDAFESGVKSANEFNDKLKNLLEEVKSNPKVIAVE